MEGLLAEALLDSQGRERAVGRDVVRRSRVDAREHLLGHFQRCLVKAGLHTPCAIDARAGVDDLDLGDEEWRAVEIDTTGWRVIDNPPVRFRRAGGMQPLPVPLPGGSVETLRSFLNVQSDADFVLIVSWVPAALSSTMLRVARVISSGSMIARACSSTLHRDRRCALMNLVRLSKIWTQSSLPTCTSTT